MRLRLVVVAGPDAGRELVLEAGTYRVGKAEDCDLILTDSAVSRVHLLVSVLEAGARLDDNDSTNGSYMADSRFKSVEVGPGALVRIGKTEFQLLPVSAAGSVAPISGAERFGLLVGKSRKMREVYALLERLAQVDTAVLILGETGTGKEVCAESLHRASNRKAGPFVVCDLAAVSPTLFESELFGHVRGAFTGAVSERPGAFERAHGGTVFLDEVGEVPLDIQPRLLRALERKQVKRVGGNDYRTVDVRVVAATHRDLAARVKAGTFREDLYHRLSVASVKLPPLRERVEDLPVLIDEMLSRLSKPSSALSPETRALLRAHDWPGNIRELRNVVERVVSLGPVAELPAARPGSKGAVSSDALPFKEAKEALVTAFERDYLVGLLQRCENNIRRAAREAGIDRVYLKKLLTKHGLRGTDSDKDAGD